MPEFIPPEYSADQPIESKKQDLLNRTDFSNSIAISIKNWTGKNSLVLALYGGWGSGKSSIKGLVLEKLKSEGENCPYIVEFNPWLWSNQEKLFDSFFKEIGLSIKKSFSESSEKSEIPTWDFYVAKFKLASASVGFISNLIFIFSIVFLISSNAFYANVVWVNRAVSFTSWAFLLFALFTRFSDSSEKVSESIAFFLQKKKVLNEKSVEEIKRQLSEDLSKIKKPILVVVDDVDRLAAEEVKILFQLIKANANFPNLVFVLFFQRDVIEKSLENSLGVDGKEYLEKIVQLGFDVPEISRKNIEKILFSKLEGLVENKIDSFPFDAHRWQNIYYAGLNNYFNNLRDIYRYISTLEFHIGLFRNDKDLEINIIDLMVLEAMRVFEPLVYERFKESKEYLTDHSRDHKNVNPTAEYILSAIKDERKKADVRKLLTYIFPNITPQLANIVGSRENDLWVKEMRACHPGFFDRYFQLTIAPDDISTGTITRIIAGSDFKSNIVSEFDRCISNGSLKTVLERLESYHSEIPVKNLYNFVEALFEVGDQIERDKIDTFDWTTLTRAWRLIYWSVERFPDRPAQIIKLLRETRGIVLPVDFVAREKLSEANRSGSETRLFDDSTIKQMVEICLSKIKSKADQNTIAQNNFLADILEFWSFYGDQRECQEWSIRYLSFNRDNLFNLLEQFVNKRSVTGSPGDVIKKYFEVFDIVRLSQIVPWNYVSGQLSLFKDENLNARQLTVKALFLKAYKQNQALNG